MSRAQVHLESAAHSLALLEIHNPHQQVQGSDQASAGSRGYLCGAQCLLSTRSPGLNLDVFKSGRRGSKFSLSGWMTLGPFLSL